MKKVALGVLAFVLLVTAIVVAMGIRDYFIGQELKKSLRDFPKLTPEPYSTFEPPPPPPMLTPEPYSTFVPPPPVIPEMPPGPG